MGDAVDLGRLQGPVLVFGGPYSNLQATAALRAVAEGLGIAPGRTICTGDVVAYCGQPAETVELMRTWGVPVVRGNCEESLGADAPDCGCGFEAGTACSLLAVDWYRFAQGQLTADQKAWLRATPPRVEFRIGDRRVAVLHGAVDAINRFLFRSTPDAAIRRQLDLAGTDVVIGGHCGIPHGRRLGGRAWLNSGAIGLPANDGTRDGWYLLLEEERGRVVASWHRLAYDAAAAAAAMAERGLCGGYHRTLLDGLWPSLDVLPEAERALRGVPLGLQSLVL